MGHSSCVNDASFGPVVRGCRGGFDFTIAFEQAIFSIAPAALFTLASAPQVRSSILRRKIVHAVFFGSLKLAVIAVFACSKLALLVLTALGPTVAKDVSLASAALQVVAALCMLAVSYLEHERAARPSILLSAYLFFTSLLDIAQTRTLWLSADTKTETAVASVFSLSLALKVCILLLEAQRKTKWIRWGTSEPHSPEETSGIYSIGMYSWLNPLFFAGYRNPIQMESLYALDRNMASEDLYSRFRDHADFTGVKGRYLGLVRATMRTLWWQLLLPVFPRAALTGFTICQPFLLNAVLRVLSSPVEPDTADHKYGLIGASVFIYAGFAISTAFYWYFHWRFLQMTRGVLVTALYDKATKVRHGSEAGNDAVTLMSIDMERIVLGFTRMHEVWASVLEVALTSWFLYNEVGAAFVAAILVALTAFTIIYVLTNFTARAQKAWMEEVQRRVGLTATMIAKMKNIRIAGLTAPVFDAIQKARVIELKRSSRVRTLAITATTISFTTYTISPVLTFALSGRHLDSDKVYTSLAFLMVMATSSYMALRSAPQLANAFICMGRIQTYLESEERQDYRTIIPGGTSQAEHSEDEKGTDGDTPAAFVIKDGSFGWQEGQSVLSKINLNLPKGGLTIVSGPVACGKSTLCQALLGEVPYHAGKVAIHSTVARVGYCEQSPFLSNCTIRENIISHSPFDQERYAEVINATLLDVDFETLSHGDNTAVGSNGIVLSGGQKQRIALARALYLQTDTLILDDVFSGLDADTEEQVFRRVFGPFGIVRRQHKTVVLCTHSIRHLPFADHIVIMSESGQIVEQGKAEMLHQTSMDRTGADSHVRGSETSSEDIDLKDDKSYTTTELVCSQIQPSKKLLKDTVESGTKPILPVEPKEEGTWSVYKYYIKSIGLTLVLCQLLAAVAHGLLYNFPTVWLQYWTSDAYSAHPKHTTGYYLGIYGLLEVGCLLSLLVLGYLIWVITIRKAGANLHHDALTTLTHAPLSYLTKTDQGQITNLFSQDMNLLDTELANALLNTLMNASLAIGQAAVIVAATPYIAIGYPVLLLVLWLIQKVYLRTSRRLRILSLESKSPLYTHFLDTTKGLVSLRAFGYMVEDRVKQTTMLDESQRPAYFLYMVQEWLTLVLNLVVAGMAVMLVSLALELRANVGITGASLVTVITLGDNLNITVQQWTRLETSIGAVKRIREFNETVKAEDQPAETILPGEDWPANGRIELRSVSAAYDTEVPEEKLNLALNNVNLDILPGEKVAICGRTGSGKSTTIALLLKLLDSVPGSLSEVMIDGISLHAVDRGVLRRRLIALPQEAVLLPDGSSYRQNLDPLDMGASDADCRDVLELVNLWGVVESTGGLEASVTSTSFSHGQQQLFALAQAVIRRRRRSARLAASGGSVPGGVLLLDEATSSVDMETERLMQNVIREEFKTWTVVAVSHRLEMVMDFDKIVVMDKGEVVETGNPKALVALAGSKFGKLWKASKGE